MRYANHFYVANFLPSRRRDCHTTIPRLSPTLPKPHYPLLCTITLASLVKGRWIDGKAQALILLLSACDMPTIFMLQTFCRQDGGIATPLFLASHQPFQNRTIPCFAPSHLPPLLKVRCCRPKKFGRLPEGLSLHQPFQNRTIPCFAPSHLPPLSKVRCCRPKKFGRLPEGLSLHQPFQNRTIPCFAPSHLPPLLKGGGLTARHKP